ncbi:hypothetical protein [Reichenbachiella ulvae]|uniref:Uncharacterized protein n=1 Tax=Reichenbachiella ulvae TaxID=2980104 RepID=A0ABT3D0L6_9BACT|nr:hypothetical protein [Reichenbachiella ulvae]MCV9389314.1 hypothetical protein [Reichenbachiella ulvae]
MKTKILLGLLLIGLLACDKDESIDCCVNIDTYIDLRLQDADGHNLLEGDQAWTTGDIQVYHHLEDGWEISTNNLMIIERESENCLRFFASEEIVADNISETKLILPEVEEGIFKTELSNTGSSLIMNSLWYNDVLLWEITDSSDRFFTLTVQ